MQDFVIIAMVVVFLPDNEVSPVCVLGEFHGMEPEVLEGVGETDKVVCKAPLLVQLTALRSGVLV
jgi:hypothetical protein